MSMAYLKNMNRKNIISLIIIILLIVTSIGGYFLYQKFQPKTSNRVMKIAKYYWPGTYWVEIADQKGWFKEAGLNVELIDTNSDYIKSLADTASGKIDTANFSPFDLVEYDAKGADLVSVLNSDFSNGTDGIVAKAGINSIRELKGKKIGVPNGSYLDYILDVVLIQNGLDPEKDVIKIEADPEDMTAGFISGKYDAVVNWQPLLSEVASKGNGKIIFDSSEIKGLNSGNWVFKRNLIKERPADVQAFVDVWNKTTNFIKSNPDEAYGIIAKIYKVTPAEVAELEKIDNISNLNDALIDFSYSSGFGSIHGAINKINDYLIGQKIISQRIDSTEIVDPTFMRKIIK